MDQGSWLEVGLYLLLRSLMLVDLLERRPALEKPMLGNMTMEWSADWQWRQTCGKGEERELHPSLRTADAFPVVASLPPKNFFLEGEKRRPEMHLLFAG